MLGLRKDCNILREGLMTYIVIENYKIPISWKFAFFLALMDGSRTEENAVDIAIKIGLLQNDMFDIALTEIKRNCGVFLETYPSNYIRKDIPKPSSFLVKDQPDISLLDLPFPLNMYYHVTDACDKHCIYCFLNNKQKKLENEILTEKELKNIIDQLSYWGVKNIVLSGGEPFLRTDIFRILEYASNYGIWTTITTKHYFIEKEAEILGNLGNIEIGLSYDSHINKIADFLSGMKNHALRMQESIKWLLKYNVDVNLQPIITAVNIDYIDDYLRHVEKLGISKVTFHPYMPIGSFVDEILICSEEQIKRLNDIFQRHNDRIDINLYKTPFDAVSMDYVPPTYGCVEGISTVSVKKDGKVVMCHMDDEPSYGNLRIDSLEKIWNHPDRKKLCFPPKEQYLGTPCENCDIQNECLLKSVCRRQALLETGSPFGLSSLTKKLCLRYKEV